MRDIKKSSPTKDVIFQSAISLFYDHGFDGTSVRDIANKAKVNPSNISYYFKGKQGLLETCFNRFFEEYLSFLEAEVHKLEQDSTADCLKRSVFNILHFQSENYLMARFVWREVSIDSQVIREIISSYLMKEKYYMKVLLEAGMSEQTLKKQPISFLVIQLKSMLTMPFLNSQQLREVWHMFPHEHYFVEQYYQHIEAWIDMLFMSETEVSDGKLIVL